MNLFSRLRSVIFFATLTLLTLFGLKYQDQLIKNWYSSSGSLIQRANNLVAVQADVPSDYLNIGAGGVFCQDPGGPLIPIPGVIIQLDGVVSGVPPEYSGLNGPKTLKNIGGYNGPVNGTRSDGSFKTGDFNWPSLSVTQIWAALSNGFFKPNVRVVNLPETLPAAITNPDFRRQTPTAQFCQNGALGLCQNSASLCSEDNTYYRECDMRGLTDQQALERSGGLVFLYTNCAAATLPPPPPPVVPICIDTKVYTETDGVWTEINYSAPNLSPGQTLRLKVKGDNNTLLDRARFHVVASGIDEYLTTTTKDGDYFYFDYQLPAVAETTDFTVIGQLGYSI